MLASHAPAATPLEVLAALMRCVDGEMVKAAFGGCCITVVYAACSGFCAAWTCKVWSTVLAEHHPTLLIPLSSRHMVFAGDIAGDCQVFA
jgi:hypothetical protein